MKSIFLFLSIFFCNSFLFAQDLTTPPDGGNKKAVVGERIGITDVTIHYDRPAVKGREGKIWNGLVHTGFMDLGFGSSKNAPWRAGANENTTITFSTNVYIDQQPLSAGTYALFAAMGEGTATLIFSKNSTSWGSFFYDPKEDALRVNVKTLPLSNSVERLKYEFMDETDTSAVVALQWEKLKIPFTVSVDFAKQQLESFRNELRSSKGFKSEAWVQAAQFAADHNDLNDADTWSDFAINGKFIGETNFRTLTTRAMILQKKGDLKGADQLYKEALSMATMIELHQYGRKLITEKKYAEALEVFKMNATKNPGQFTTYAGLMRGYAAIGDNKNALKNALLALPLAPDKLNKDSLEVMIGELKSGKGI